MVVPDISNICSFLKRKSCVQARVPSCAHEITLVQVTSFNTDMVTKKLGKHGMDNTTKDSVVISRQVEHGASVHVSTLEKKRVLHVNILQKQVLKGHYRGF